MKNIIAAAIALILPREPGLFETYRPDIDPDPFRPHPPAATPVHRPSRDAGDFSSDDPYMLSGEELARTEAARKAGR